MPTFVVCLDETDCTGLSTYFCFQRGNVQAVHVEMCQITNSLFDNTYRLGKVFRRQKKFFMRFSTYIARIEEIDQVIPKIGKASKYV